MATPPAETPGGGEGLAVIGAGVGVGNAVEAGVGPGGGIWANAVEQMSDAPRTATQTWGSLMDWMGGMGVLFLPPQ